MFNESSYIVDENNEEIKLTLILSNPSSSNVSIFIMDIRGSANSKSFFNKTFIEIVLFDR